jgi:hypothetical protein
MPCHVEEFPPNAVKNEISTVVKIVNGKITMKCVGDEFYGKYPTTKDIIMPLRKKFKTFHYKVFGTMLVFVSPCPKGC